MTTFAIRTTLAGIGYILDTFIVTLELRASYTFQIPAEDVEQAIQLAYNRPIISERLYDIEKKVVRVMKLSETSPEVSLTLENAR